MSSSNKRSTLTWVLIAIVVVAAVTSGSVFKTSMLVLPFGYRAYEWTWKFRIELVPESRYAEYPNIVKNTIIQELGKTKDDKGQPVTIYNGPTFRETKQTWIFFSRSFLVECETHIWFYGYFPNGIPGATQDIVKTPVDALFDFFFPKAYAFTGIEVIVILIISLLIAGLACYTIITVTNTWREVQVDRAIFDDPTIPGWAKVIYAIFVNIYGFLKGLGIWAILLIGVGLFIVVFGWPTGRRRR